MKRRRFLLTGARAGAIALGAPALIGLGRRDADLVLRGGVVIDGTGRPRFDADVAITGDRVVRIAPRLTDRGATEIDCRNHIVAPGFVDVHTHADGSLFDDPMMESVVRQGVTTVVIGADGSSRAPRADGGGMRALLDSIAAVQPGANVASMVGLGTIRGIVVGDTDRPTTPAELARMVALVEQSLAEGAVGASSGLEYTPGAFASLGELIALCTPLASRRLAYHTHMRNEDDRLLEAIDESIAVARGAGCGLQISHLKTQGPRNWGKLDDVFARVATARAAGTDVAFDRYPYLAYQTGLTNLFPVWARDGGTARFLERLDQADTAARIRTEALGRVELIGGWGNVQITSVSAAEDKPAEGKRLDAWARERSVEPYAMAVAMLKRNRGSVGMIGFAMSEENLERILRHEWGMVASDGGALAVDGPARRGVPHPRGAGSFARVLGRYVRERKTLTLEQAVRKMSALPASRVKLAGRGTLAEGSYGDVVVFDPASVADKADFANPFQYAVGIKATIVNGAMSFLEGDRISRTGTGAARPMKIYSWNVNGLRAVLRKGDFQRFLAKHRPDVLCLQETKADREQVEIDLPDYVEFWNSASKKGYSGTAIFARTEPIAVTNGFSSAIHKRFKFVDTQRRDSADEGRVITAEFASFYVVTVYTPNAKDDLSRLKLRHKHWDPAFLAHCKHLEKKKPVIFCGDLNVAHTELDLANPKPNVGKKGFTVEERRGFQSFLDAGFVDTFRIFTQGNGHYSWWSAFSGARARNVGWRIDYVLVSSALRKQVKSATIHADVMGSDHCPVSITL